MSHKGNREFLQTLARSDDPFLIDHDPEVCGHCAQMILWATVAREMLKAEDYDISKWNHEASHRWQQSKFYKLWRDEAAAGRDPHIAFAERGWEP